MICKADLHVHSLASPDGRAIRMILGLDYFLSVLEEEARQASAG